MPVNDNLQNTPAMVDQSSRKEVHGMLVAGFVLAGLPILGLIFTIIAYKQTKERGTNRELGLIALIQSIVIHSVVAFYLLLFVVAWNVSRNDLDDIDPFDSLETTSEATTVDESL